MFISQLRMLLFSYLMFSGQIKQWCYAKKSNTVNANFAWTAYFSMPDSVSQCFYYFSLLIGKICFKYVNMPPSVKIINIKTNLISTVTFGLLIVINIKYKLGCYWEFLWIWSAYLLYVKLSSQVILVILYY